MKEMISIKEMLEKKAKIKKKTKISKIDSHCDSITTKNTIIDVPITNSRRWSKKEVRILYRGLVLFGTDFSSIASLIETKNRNQIIKKFHREERKNYDTVEMALKKHLNCVDRLIHNFSGIVPEDSKLETKKRLNSFLSTDSIDPLIKANLCKNLNLN